MQLELEIFKGKKREYNKLVLKALYEKGYLTAWGIAKEVALNNPERKKGNWYHEAQKVSSVLVRKNGRLGELAKKEYIQKTDDGYRLTYYKGIAAALTVYKDVREPKIDVCVAILQDVDERLRPELEEVFEVYNELYSKEELYKELLRATKELQGQGLNFDVISNKEFTNHLQMKIEDIVMREAAKREDIEKVNPKLREKTIKLFIKTKNVFIEEMKRLTEELNRIEETLNSLTKAPEKT